MEQLWNLLLGAPDEWSGGIAHSILILAVAIASGIALGKVRVGGVSLGSVWILFVGILFGYLDIGIDSRLLLFLKEAGLILFVYSIGMQVGSGFFAPFRKGGLQLNAVALTVVGAGVAVAVVLHQATGGSAATLIGVLSGTAANAPGLGAAQEAAAGADGSTVSDMALGYALACPLGIVGCISMLWVLKHVFRVNAAREEAAADAGLWNPSELKACSATLEIRNRAVEGMTFGLAVCVYAQFLPATLTGVFTNDAAVVDMAAGYLRGYSIDCVMVSFVFCFNSYFSGQGNSLFPMIHSLIATFLFRIPLSYLFGQWDPTDLQLMGYAPPLSTLVSLLICLWYLRRNNRKLRAEHATA